jgi:signal transduction histidine kinase
MWLLCRCVALTMRGSSVVLSVDARLPGSFFVDPTRLRQIVMNGLTNCAKYGSRGDSVTAIELNARMGGAGELIIEALDRGSGLQGRTLADLSSEFVVPAAVPSQGAGEHPTLDSAFDNVRSTGMGIPICLRLAALMGGSLGLADRSDGQGVLRAARSDACSRVSSILVCFCLSFCVCCVVFLLAIIPCKRCGMQELGSG